MMDRALLDSHLIYDFNLDNEEKIIWEGAPKQGFNISLPNSIFVAFVLTILLIWAFTYFRADQGEKGFFVIGILSILFLVKDTIRYFRKKNTKYFLTNKRLVLKLWRFWNSSFHDIPLQNIVRVAEVIDLEDLGVLNIQTKPFVNFRTYSLKNITMRHHPTLELLEDPEFVKYLIIDAVNDAKQEKRFN